MKTLKSEKGKGISMSKSKIFDIPVVGRTVSRKECKMCC